MKRLSILLAVAIRGYGQTIPAAVPMPTPEVQYFGTDGKPLAGGKLCTYAANTTTPLATYTDSTAGTPNTNPVTLDVAGRASVWIGPQLYKFVLKSGGTPGSCADGVVQWTQDNVSDATLYFVNYVKTAGTATLITFTPPNSQPQETVDAALTKLINNGINPMDFGCTGDGVADDTACWTAAIASAVSTNRPIVCLENTYLVSKQGTVTFAWDGLAHPYVFLVANPLTITGSCQFTSSMTDAATANVFIFQNTRHVRVSGATFTGTGSMSNQVLYGGAGVVFDHCNDCYGYDLKSFTMRGNLLAFNSSDVGCSHCFSSGATNGKQGSHWAGYACVGAVFSENTGYGGTTDGDMTLFGYQNGSPAVGNKLVNNKLYNYAFEDASKTIVVDTHQGYLADSGQTGALISGNYAYGYYYCIDVKTQSNGTSVMGNTAEKCKVGIAVRLGETPIITQSTSIVGNSIRPLGGNGNTFSFDGLTDTLGIWIEDAFGVTIADNIIEASWLFGFGEQDFIPIYAQIFETGPYYVAPNTENSVFTNGLNIHDNVLAMEQQQGATYTYSSNSVIVVAGNATNPFPKVKIHDNIIKFRTDAPITGVPISVNYARNLDISRNSFDFQPGQSGLYTIEIANAQLITVNDNHLDQFGGFLKVTTGDQIGVSGNVLYQQTRDGSSNAIPLIYSDASTNWIIANNQRIQPAGNVDNGRFFEGVNATGNVVLVKNIMDQEVFEDDWYKINTVVNANTADVMSLDNLRLGPIDGPMRTYTGTTAAIGGSALTAGQCLGVNYTGIHGIYPGMKVDVYPSGLVGPGNQFFYKGVVSAHNTVTVIVCAATAGTPTSLTYQVNVHQ